MKKRKPITFDPKLSLKLDKATIDKERGKLRGKIVKRYLEWKIFGGKP